MAYNETNFKMNLIHTSCFSYLKYKIIVLILMFIIKLNLLTVLKKEIRL